ncbi:MAG: hypothetical protein HRF50_06375 [Phycisphaerae bacterium]|jgi:hypothetical protein
MRSACGATIRARGPVLKTALAAMLLGLPATRAAGQEARRIDLQAAINQSDVVQIPAGDWLLDRHVRVARPNVRIECPSGMARLITVAFGPERQTPILDATGGYGLLLRNIEISTYGDAQTAPAGAGLLLGRDEKLSPMSAKLDNVLIRGRFRVAALVNVAGECSGFYNCEFTNSEPGGHAVLFVAQHPQRLSAHSHPRPQTCLQNAFFNCSLGVNNPFGPRCDGSACLAVESLENDTIGDITLFGGGFSAKQPGSFGVLIRCRGRGGHVNGLALYGLRAECNESEAVIRVDQPDGQTASFVTWVGGSAVFSKRFVHVLGEFAISNWKIDNVHLTGGVPEVPVVQVPHAQRCWFDLTSAAAPWPIQIEKSTRGDVIRVQAGRRAEVPKELRGTRVENE